MLRSLMKAAVAVVSVPVTVVADVVTMGGALTERERPYTYDACADLVQNLQDATRPSVE